MNGLSPILIGATVLLAGAAIGATAILSPKSRARAVYAQLVLMAGIYVGFAIIGLDPIGNAGRAAWSGLLIESLIAAAFILGGLGVLASARAWLLGVLILGHGGVDVLHLLFSDIAPHWYAYLCVTFDAIAGSAYVWLLGKQPDAAPVSS